MKTLKQIISRIVVSLMALNIVFMSVNADISIKFDKDVLQSGENTFEIFGTANESGNFDLIYGIYENGQLKSIENGGSYSLTNGNSFSEEGSINLTNPNLPVTSVKVSLVKSEDNPVPLSEEYAVKGVSFSYDLTNDCSTSAGVYNQDGKLVKTLWGGLNQKAGSYTKSWDGRDDYGRYLPDGEYSVKVLKSNVIYTQDGSVGSNSDITGLLYNLSDYSPFSDMTYHNGTMYYAQSYSETHYTQRAFETSNPYRLARYTETRPQNPYRCANDGERVYYLNFQALMADKNLTNKSDKVNQRFVSALDIISGDEYEFTDTASAIPLYNYGQVSFVSTVAREEYGKGENRAGGAYYGEVFLGDIDVAKENPYLAVVYPQRDYVTIINKYSGTTINKNAITNPTSVAFDNSDRLWLLSGNDAKDLSLYSIANNGVMTKVLSAPTSVATSEVIAIDISPDGDEMAVVYGGDTNKVIGYNTSNWSINWSYGSGESYKADPTVKDDKLMFMAKTAFIRFGNPLKSIDYSFVTYEDDNTVWFGDTGNARHMAININGGNTAPKHIVYVRGCNYNSSVVLNDPARVFSSELEYEIDYSKSSENNDYWKLKNNWSYIMLGKFARYVQTSYHYINDMVKLSNGRTYFAATALDGENDPYLDIEDLATEKEKTDLRNAKKEDFYLWELTDTGVRNTGISLNGCSIIPDGKGTIQYIDYVEMNNKKEKGLYQKYVTGFDESNNPIYSEAVYVGGIPSDDLQSYAIDEYTAVDNKGLVYGFYGRSPHSGASYTRTGQVEMRLAAYDTVKNDYAWETAPATSTNYKSDFPRDGSFTIGNGVWNTVRQVKVYDENIMMQYFGEGYNGAQANVFYHFNNDGLLIGVFGEAMNQQAEYEDYGQEMVNGNGFCWQMVKSPTENDVYYIYQGGESRFNGVIRTRIEGLDSVTSESIPVYLKNNLSSGLVKNIYQTSSMKSEEKSKDLLLKNTAEGIYDTYFTLKGYIKAPENLDKALKLMFCSDGDIAVKVDGKDFASGSNMVLATADFEKGVAYPIEITVKNNSEFKFLYKDAKERWKDYPYNCIFSDIAYNYVLSRECNLLENVPFDKEISAEESGWDFIGVTDGTVKITSNLYNYSLDKDNDISISFKGEINTPYYALKTLDTDDNAKAIWEVNTDLVYLGSLSGHYDTYLGDLSRYIEILDINGKVIARFDCRYEDFSPYGNDIKIADLPVPADYTTVKSQYAHPLSTPFNLRIVGDNGKISFSFNDKTVTADDVFEAGAIWNKPKAIRLYNYKTYSNMPEFEYRFLKLNYYEYDRTYQHKVEFYDEKNALIQTSYVKNGEKVTPPQINRDGFIVSWDKPTDCVTEDMKVYLETASDETLYKVRFFDENRRFIETQTAYFGSSVASPLGEKSGYKLYWRDTNGRHVDISNITKNVDVFACYDKLINITERFGYDSFKIVYPTYDESGNKLKSGYVETNSGFKFNMNDSAYKLTDSEEECLYVNGTNVGKYDPNLLRISFDPVKSDKVKIKFNTKITHYVTVAGARDFGAIYDSQGNCVAKIGASNTGIYAFNGVNMADMLTYDTKNWHDIEYQIDFNTRTYMLIFDGITYGPYKLADYRASDVASVYFEGSDTAASNNAMNWYMEYITVTNQ